MRSDCIEDLNARLQNFTGVMWGIEGFGWGSQVLGGQTGHSSSGWWLDGQAEERPLALRLSVATA